MCAVLTVIHPPRILTRNTRLFREPLLPPETCGSYFPRTSTRWYSTTFQWKQFATQRLQEEGEIEKMSLPDARTIAANSAAPTSRISAESSAGRSEVQHVPRPQAAGWEQDISIPVGGSGGHSGTVSLGLLSISLLLLSDLLVRRSVLGYEPLPHQRWLFYVWCICTVLITRDYCKWVTEDCPLKVGWKMKQF